MLWAVTSVWINDVSVYKWVFMGTSAQVEKSRVKYRTFKRLSGCISNYVNSRVRVRQVEFCLFWAESTAKNSLVLLFLPFSQAADLSKPIDKRIYKGTQPTCHDFNPLTATAESVSLLVGFSAGQVQLIDPIKKETSKLFNEEVGSCRLLQSPKSKVTIF